MRFSYKYPYFHICDTPHHNFPTYLFAKYAAKFGLLPVATFDRDEGNPEAMRLLETKKNLVVEGWTIRFYDLFLKYREEITSLFAFRPQIKDKVKALLADTAQAGGLKLGVHIRRGDYKTWQGGRYYYDNDVYISQIRQFAALHADRPVTVYICGNDPSVDKSYYQERLRQMPVHFPNGNPAEDLCLLSECDYLIGPPSTFSLVASMYRDTPLCWIKDGNEPLSKDKFRHFDVLFKQIV